MDLPEKVQALPAELRAVWEKAYKMALKRFANNTAKAAKVADKAVSQAKAKMGKSDSDQPFAVSAEISKVDEDQGLVYGWFYTCEKDGLAVVDHSEEKIDQYDLEKAFVGYMLNSRAGGEMHIRKGEGEAGIVEHNVATLVGGLVFTDETVKMLGLPDDTTRGAFGVFKVHDPEVLAKARSGEYAMFSIGGSGKRKSLDPDEPASGVQKLREEVAKAESLEHLSDGAVAYLTVQAAASATEAMAKGTGPDRHGPSIKCPDIYDALRREGHMKTSAAKISNECHSSPKCKCH